MDFTIDHLTIVYEDRHVLIVDKPAGILIHPVSLEKSVTLADLVLEHYLLQQIDAKFHPVVRLDRQTSGLVLIAKKPEVHAWFAKQMDRKKINRSYLAVAHGCIRPPEGTLDLPIARKPGSMIERCVAPEGQNAVTHYRTLYTCKGFSVLLVQLDTGRTHQIRVHFSHIGHPLLGDDLYGGSRQTINRQALHSCRLEFIHPETKETMEFTIPPPDDIQQLLPEAITLP